MIFYEDECVSPFDFPYVISFKTEADRIEAFKSIKECLEKQRDTAIVSLLDSYINKNPQDNLNKEKNKYMEKRIKIGNIVEYTSRPDFGLGIVIGIMKDNWFSIIFSKFSVRPQSVHINDLSLCERTDYKLEITPVKSDTNKSLPDIVDYKYDEDTGKTIIKWSDNTETPVKADFPDTASAHEGFMTACAKKAFGNDNTANNLFDKWVVKKPAREQKAQIKANAELLEEQRIAKKRKAKKEQWLTRKRAVEIAKEYDAKKLAHEKYGVPMDFKAGEDN